jgi:hypothetical protein
MNTPYPYTHCASMVDHYSLLIDLARNDEERSERARLLVYWQEELLKSKN